jgi:predicted AAA+ superfamily ATPase
VKTPKLYFIDSAIVCAMTRLPSGEAPLAGPMGGPLFEGFIVSETLKIAAAAGKGADCFFWRSHDGLEVDLVLQMEGKLLPIEIKLTATPTLKHLEPLNQFKGLAEPEGSPEGILICRVEKPTPLPQNNLALPWQKFPSWLQERLS